ncbi:protein chibby homolog 1 [Phlebotomus argentipes]|uniref:protein chibby homolog 1 n=1 Tax=Phlebotomus argentipes TaxID=94469 RepID=UPI002892CB7D|nr:protein chibby homolog 1 [Phlebotomus argentipes]
MPIFSKKFSYKSAPPRNKRVLESDCPRIHEKLEEFRNIHLQLSDDGGYTFANGCWSSTSKNAKASASNNNQQLKEKITKLSEENNLLQLKVDILVDLLTENTVEMTEIKEKLMK